MVSQSIFHRGLSGGIALGAGGSRPGAPGACCQPLGAPRQRCCPGADRGLRGLSKKYFALPAPISSRRAPRALQKKFCPPHVDFKPEGSTGSQKIFCPPRVDFKPEGSMSLQKKILPSPRRFQARGSTGSPQKYFALPMPIFKPKGTGECMWNINRSTEPGVPSGGGSVVVKLNAKGFTI